MRDHENEDHVWAKNIGKPEENQWFLKIVHKRKWKSLKKTLFFQKCPRLKNAVKTIWNQDFHRAWPKNDLRDYENEDRVWEKNIGKPEEN